MNTDEGRSQAKRRHPPRLDRSGEWVFAKHTQTHTDANVLFLSLDRHVVEHVEVSSLLLRAVKRVLSPAAGCSAKQPNPLFQQHDFNMLLQA